MYAEEPTDICKVCHHWLQQHAEAPGSRLACTECDCEDFEQTYAEYGETTHQRSPLRKSEYKL